MYHFFPNPNGPNDYQDNKKKRPLTNMLIPTVAFLLIIFAVVFYSNRQSNNEAKEELESFMNQLEVHITQNANNLDDLFSNTTINNKYDINGTHFTRAEVRYTEYFKSNQDIDGNEFVFFSPEGKFEIIIYRRQNTIEIIGYVYRSRYTINRDIPIG